MPTPPTIPPSVPSNPPVKPPQYTAEADVIDSSHKSSVENEEMVKAEIIDTQAPLVLRSGMLPLVT
jgi:hypothetical protein